MRFADLYKYANELTDDYVSVAKLARFIEQNHPDIEKVEFWPVELDRNISLGHMVYERGRTSPYEDPFTVANVRFDKTQNRCWTRFICCKELMHVFDTDAESVNSRKKFLHLMTELQTRPMTGDISPMLSSEADAEWMALLVLGPERLRQKWIKAWTDKSAADYDVALALRIPESGVKSLMSDYYERALKRLLNNV